MSWRKKSDASDFSNSSKNEKYYQNKRRRFKSDPNEECSYRNKYEPITEMQNIDLGKLNIQLTVSYIALY